MARSRLSAFALAAGLLASVVCSHAGDLALPVSGNLLGTVLDARGLPEMGATIQLFNKFARLIGRTTTNADGQFAFPGLPGDSYSLRVTATSYLPVSRSSISVRAGMDSLLQIHLATLLSTVQVSYRTPVAGMSNDWKWVLRSSPATRPITRYLPDDVGIDRSNPEPSAQIFSGTRAMISVSGGDSSIIDSDTATSDMGTGFVLSTNILGRHQLQLGGNYAQDASGVLPAAMSLCALYTSGHDTGFLPSPEIAFSVTQFSLLPGQNAGPASTLAPQVRSMSLSMYQTLDPVDGVHIEYGMVGESIEYLQHSMRASPFVRTTVSLGAVGDVVASYSDGARPDELAAHQPRPEEVEATQTDDEIPSVGGTLARLPQFSYRDGQLELQRTRNFEVGLRKTAGSTTFAVSAFREEVQNGRVHVAGDMASLPAGNLVSDGISETSIYNIGAYDRNGLLASAHQRLGDFMDASVAYGRMGGFTADSTPDWTASGEPHILSQQSHNVADARLGARIPRAGTRLTASYGWMDGGGVVPDHLFTTQSSYVSPGFSVFIRQPLPSLFGIPGHFELTADLRNLLAQGYLPVTTQSGQTLLVVQAPRAVRGGVNFIF